MEESREKTFTRKDSFTKMNKNGRKETPRPRSRSVYTRSHFDDISTNGNIGQYEALNQWASYIPKPITVKNYYSDDTNNDLYGDDGYILGTTITPQGVISLRLRDRIRVDMTLDRAIRIVNSKNGIVLALNTSGSSSALLHPNGRVFQYGSRVEILALDGGGNNKYAKMWYKGVSFTSDQCALVYLVDSAGTRTTTDTFSDLSNEFTFRVFYNSVNPYLDISKCVISHGTEMVNEAVEVLQNASYWVTDDSTDNWIINNIRISQTADGLVRVGRNSNKFSLRTSPTNGSASISSPFIHCTGSMGQTRHLFVRRGERRMHYDGSTFIVRNAGHSAGFDEKHQLKVY